MRTEYFERNFGHLSDSDDATLVFGTASIKKGVATVGDIREACKGHPPDASIYLDNEPPYFYIADVHGKPFTTRR